MHKIIPCFFILLSLTSTANDGVFHMAGNQLIPVTESDISVQKEILTIRKTENGMIEVNVYYEFFNPGQQKSLIVGFEAMSPSGDADVRPVNGKHPYMKDFSVVMNNADLPFEVAIVKSSDYFINGAFVAYTPQQILAEIGDDVNYADFYYVYHFKASFKPGINIIQHTYSYNISGSVDLGLFFNYVLTAANRWANKQIDDFTLIIDMGEFESFYISSVFFENADDWKIEGEGTKLDRSAEELYMTESPAAQFHIRKGQIVFQQKNFYPRDELFLFSGTYYPDLEIKFDFRTDILPLPLRYQDLIPEPADQISRSVLRNLPFARRGYVFKNQYLKTFYELTDWYVPDPDYQGTMESMTQEEREWVEKYK